MKRRLCVYLLGRIDVNEAPVAGYYWDLTSAIGTADIERAKIRELPPVVV